MPNSRNVYVAVIDDDESLNRSFSRLLRAEGIQPIMYDSGESFLEDTKRPQFDCLVMDIQLGGMSGLELFRALRGIGNQTPVIFVTAFDSVEVREEAVAAECAGYFAKTDDGDDVVAAIRRVTG